MEIERRFRLPAMPRLELPGGFPIVQGYLPDSAGGIRIRRIGPDFRMTVKGDGDIAREEWETPLPAWVFEQLWPCTTNARVEKTRYRIAHGDFAIELDTYHGALEGLVIFECEFPDITSSEKFSLPPWAADALDVTKDRRYNAASLARSGTIPD